MTIDRRSYPSDLSDREWKILEPLLPTEKPGGRHRGYHGMCCKNDFEAGEVAYRVLLCSDMEEAQDELRLAHHVTSG